MPPLPSAVRAALASSRSRRRRAEEDALSAVGTTWRAALVSDQRGPVLTRKAASKLEAYSLAHVLLDQAADMAWYRGEVVGVRVEQDAGG